jgi:UDP:flavonoid glycosyltransferase YjiC (YdhE family)
MRSDLLGQDIIKKILTTFKEIPDYNFLWKFESDELPMEKPDNVMLIKFLKQNDVLAHSGIKLFISHCGLMSTQESLWHGKPLIGVPLYGDQQRVIVLKSILFNTLFIVISL